MADSKTSSSAFWKTARAKIAPGASVDVHIERPKNPEHGDLSSNVAMQLSKQLKRKPRDVAQEFIDATADALRESGFAEPITIAGPGFLNVRLKPVFKLQP